MGVALMSLLLALKKYEVEVYTQKPVSVIQNVRDSSTSLPSRKQQKTELKFIKSRIFKGAKRVVIRNQVKN